MKRALRLNGLYGFMSRYMRPEVTASSDLTQPFPSHTFIPSMSMLRGIDFDDEHPAIRYSGSWVKDDKQDEEDPVGYVFRGSQHRTDGPASLEFSFNGA